DLDVGLLGLPENRRPRGVAWRNLGADRHVAVLSRDHALAGRAEVGLRDLAAESFVDFGTGSPGRTQSDLAFDAAGLARDVAFEVMATDLMIDLVRQNLAVVLLPSRYALPVGDLVSVPIADGPTRAEYLAWSDFNPSPAARAFLDIVG